MSELYRSAIGGKAAAHAAPAPIWTDLLLPKTYLLVLLLPTILLMAITVPWVRYANVAPGKWMMPEMDYRYTLHDVNADVVVFGDSTGVVSLDPVVMQDDLHASVVNIASLGSIFTVQLDGILDHYLQHNKAPKLLVISLSPWATHVDPITANNSYEGIVMLVRHGSWPEVMQFVRQHPMAMVYFEFQALRSLLNPIPYQDPDLHQLATHRGFAPIHGPAMSAPCRVVKQYSDPLAADGVAAHFYRKYSTPETKVLVLMAPVPDCTGADQYRSARSSSGWLVPSAVVPPQELGADGRHLEGPFTASFSRQADGEIENFLAASHTSLQ